MRLLLRAAERDGQIASARKVRFWVTEFSWDSNPPDPNGVPTTLLTRWTAEALYRMWRSEVTLVTWFWLRDDPLSSSPFQSGLYYRCTAGIACDQPKPIMQAFRFPFVAYRSKRGLFVWGRVPANGRTTVSVEQSRGGKWVRLTKLRAGANGIFDRKIRRPRAGGDVRARVIETGELSAAFSLIRPPDQAFQPFG